MFLYSMHEYRKLTNIALSYYRNMYMLILTKTDHLLQEPNQRRVKSAKHSSHSLTWMYLLLKYSLRKGELLTVYYRLLEF